jgi:hypothetical protein
MDGQTQGDFGREIIQCKTTVSEASRAFYIAPSEIEEWVDEAKRSHAGDTCQKKASIAAGARGREMMNQLQQDLKSEGMNVTMSQLCRWFDSAGSLHLIHH